MLNKIARYIAETAIMQPDRLYLVAVSGGADSVALLLSLLRLGYRVEVAHCNFQLRGEESLRDEAFVKCLCQDRQVAFHVAHFDTTTYARLHQLSIEMAARRLRYAWFEQLCCDIGADAVCVAHHQDDSVETVLLNLVRGTGLRGLTGIQPRQGHIVRPLLCVGRRDIEEWLRQQGQNYVTDSTNLASDYERNYLRNRVIPLLSERHPSFATSVLTTARRVGEALRVYEQSVGSALQRLLADESIAIASLWGEPSPESILFEWLAPCGFAPAVVETIARRLPNLPSGREWLTATHVLFVHQERLCLRPLSPAHPPLTIPETGTYCYDADTTFRITLQTALSVSRAPFCATVDADRVRFPLTIRAVAAGDCFHPFGMKGTKLVSDYLTDRHLSVYDKRRQLVVTTADGTILWLVGHRTDDRFRISNPTRQVLMIEVVELGSYN